MLLQHPCDHEARPKPGAAMHDVCLTVHACAQLCTEALWAAIMAQVATLDMSQQALPEEALTQMYQARCRMCLHSRAPLFLPFQTAVCFWARSFALTSMRAPSGLQFSRRPGARART